MWAAGGLRNENRLGSVEAALAELGGRIERLSARITVPTWAAGPNLALTLAAGLPQDWGSGGDCHFWVRVVGWLELLSEAGTERAIVDGTPNLEQQIGAPSRPAHLL